MNLLLISPVKYRSMVGGRYVQMVNQLIQKGVKVHWVEPPISGTVEADALNPLPLEGLKLYQTLTATGYLPVRVLKREQYQKAVVLEVLSQSKIDAAVVVDAGGTSFARRELMRKGIPVILDCTDRMYLFNANPAAVILHRYLTHRGMKSVDGIICTAHELVNEARLYNPRCILVPNGASLGLAPKQKEPSKTVVVGYVGALEWWVDFQPMEYAARKLPDVKFVIIGDGRDRPRAEELAANNPNIEYKGKIPMAKVSKQIETFDLGIIPFAVNELTHAVCPLKLFEYWERGVPVLTSTTREFQKIGNVLTYESGEDLVRVIQNYGIDADPFIRSGEQGRNKVEQVYNWDKLSDQFLEAVKKFANL